MSTKDDLSAETSGSGISKASKHSTVVFNLQEKDTKIEKEGESSEDESLSIVGNLSSEEEEYLEEEPFLKEREDVDEEDKEDDYDDYLDDDDLDKEIYLQKGKYMFKEAPEEQKKHLKGIEFQKYVEKKLKAAFTTVKPDSTRSLPASASQVSTVLMAACPSSESPTPPHGRWTQIPVTLRNQSSQTEWAYESKLALKDSDALSPESSSWDIVMNEPVEKQEEERSDSLRSTYQSVLKEITGEIAAQSDTEEHVDIPQSKLLEGENRKKLGTQLKSNFEKYRKIVMWLLRQCEAQKQIEKRTFTFRAATQQLQLQQEQQEEQLEKLEPGKGKRHPCVHPAELQKQAELDTQWKQMNMKAHQGDGKLILYTNGNIFHILFPNGSGQIYYPSGNLALLICTELAKVTYIVLENSDRIKVRGLIYNSGHATFYDEDGAIWVSLSKILGYYFPKDKYQKAWNWWNLKLHVHAPPLRSISLKLNKNIQIQIRSQDKVIFRLSTPKQRQVCLNLGTKFKFIHPKLLQAMRKKTVLEVDPHPTSRKIQDLLGKIRQLLDHLTVSDLEAFTETTELMLKNVSARRCQIWF